MSESSHYDARRTEFTSGAWYAPTGRNESPDYLGAECLGFRVTRKVQSANHTARWEVTCLKCGAKKQTDSTLIKRGLEGVTGAGIKQLGACKCPDGDAEIPLRHAAVVEHYGITPHELRMVIAVLAYERTHGGEAPTRLQVMTIVKNHPSVALLVRKGWLTSNGSVPMRVSSTAKARRELWVTP
jgi:hypothetical protein